jgi:hypothetical protein
MLPLSVLVAVFLIFTSVQAIPVQSGENSARSKASLISRRILGARPPTLQIPDASRILKQQWALFQEQMANRAAGRSLTSLHIKSSGTSGRGHEQTPNSAGTHASWLMRAYRQQSGPDAARMMKELNTHHSAHSSTRNAPITGLGIASPSLLHEHTHHAEGLDQDRKAGKRVREDSSSSGRERLTQKFLRSQSSNLSTHAAPYPSTTKKGEPTLGHARFRAVPGGYRKTEDYHRTAITSDRHHDIPGDFNLDLSLRLAGSPTTSAHAVDLLHATHDSDDAYWPSVLHSSRKSLSSQ